MLIDPRPVTAEHPDTFELPAPDDLGDLRRGSGIKATFRCADLADPVRDGLAAYGPDGRPQIALVTERMWLGFTVTPQGDEVHPVEIEA